MKQQAHKKQLAQAIYYGNEQHGQSPLTRTFDTMGNTKQPVHERLGMKLLKRRVPIHGTNTSSVLPKRKQMFKQHLNNNSQQLVSRNGIKKLYRVGTIQNHLLRRRNNFSQPSNFIGQVHHMSNQKIRLRRNNFMSNPPNFQVHVKNTAAVPIRHNIKSQLNMRLQQEIKLIQSQTQSILQNYDFSEPLSVTATEIPTNDRFSQQL